MVKWKKCNEKNEIKRYTYSYKLQTDRKGHIGRSEWRNWNYKVDLIEQNYVANEKIHIAKDVKVFSY